jgi:hypothetical protein
MMIESASKQSTGLRGRDKRQSDSRDQKSGYGIVTDDRGQPVNKKKRAKPNAGQQAQKDAAVSQTPSPGEPAGGE